MEEMEEHCLHVVGAAHCALKSGHFTKWQYQLVVDAAWSEWTKLREEIEAFEKAEREDMEMANGEETSALLVEWFDGEFYAIRCLRCQEIREVRPCSLHGKVLRCTVCNHALASHMPKDHLDAMSGEVDLQ